MTKWMKRINHLERKRQERHSYFIRKSIKYKLDFDTEINNDKRYSDIVTEIDWITEKFKKDLKL